MQNFKEKRIAKPEIEHFFGYKLNARHFYTKDDERNKTIKPDKGPAMPISKVLFVYDNALHLDNCTKESQKEEGQRNEVRKSCGHTIFPTHKVVIHLMSEKNGHNRGTIGYPTYKKSGKNCKNKQYTVNYYALINHAPYGFGRTGYHVSSDIRHGKAVEKKR